jgi:hypothetical protein
MIITIKDGLTDQLTALADGQGQTPEEYAAQVINTHLQQILVRNIAFKVQLEPVDNLGEIDDAIEAKRVYVAPIPVDIKPPL